MSEGQPFAPDGLVKVRVRWAGHKDPRLGWSAQDHEIIFDHADGAYQFDGDPMLLVGETRPVGRVLARCRAGKHGIAQYLSTDAAFTRYERGLVWMMDRKARSRSANPQRIQLLGAQGGGAGKVEAGPDGRRPWTDPFIETIGVTSTIRKNIILMGPEERKLHNPYCITVRGSSFGIDGDLRDNFAFPEDHHHITDHRGPDTGLAKPNNRRSTRWYDINQAGAPSVDIRDIDGRVTERGYNQNSDRIIVVHRDAGGCAGGDPNDMNLAFNFSDRTGFAHGLAEFRASPPSTPPPEPPRDPKETSSQWPGQDNEDTYATARADAVLATLAYTRGGPLTAGHPKADKHKYATNKDGVAYNCGHIHINAKFTNETVVFDGRRNMIPAFEPEVGKGLIPVRSFEMFNPKLADPYFCGAKIGGWDFHTFINSIPIWPKHPPWVPIRPEPEPKKPITPTPIRPEPEPEPEPRQPITGDPPGLPPTKPITPTPSAITDENGEKDATARKPITSTPGSIVPPSDWGPAETTRPSHELQPRPGNTEAPSFAHGNMPEQTSPLGAQPEDTGSPVEKALREQQQRERAGMSAMDTTTLGITGVTFSDHMKTPKTLHLVSFYKHKYDSPRGNQRRALRRNPPSYTVKPRYVEGATMSEPATMEFGTSPGLAMFAPIELDTWDMRHDVNPLKLPTLSPQTLGHYPGVKLAFGFAGTFWDRIANGFEIYQGQDPLDPSDAGINQALIIDGVNVAGEHDVEKSLDIRIPALNVDILRPVVFNTTNFTATPGADHMVDTKTGSLPIIVFLPAISAGLKGSRIVIKDDGGGAGEFIIVVLASGADTIDGRSLTVFRSNWESVVFESQGSDWRMVARNTMGPRLAIHTTALTMVANEDLFYVFRGSSVLNPLLPPSPEQGDQVRVKSFSTTMQDLIIGRNGNTIESLANDLTLNYRESATLTWIEADTTWVVS